MYSLPYEAASRHEAALVLAHHLGDERNWKWMFDYARPGFPVGKYRNRDTVVMLEWTGNETRLPGSCWRVFERKADAWEDDGK